MRESKVKAAVYCYPKIGVSGLGNCMLVWARAFVYAQENGYPILAPQWVQPRIGAVIRRDPRKRFYFGEFTNAGYIDGIRRLLILAVSERVPETHDVSRANFAQVIEFEGLRDYFATLIAHRDSISRELRRIAHPTAIRRADEVKMPFIAMHVRRGDTTRQKIPASEILQVTPTEWFVEAIDAIRSDARWRDLPVKVFSDGSPDELKEILARPGCEFATTNKAIGDIFLLSRASLLIASGYSTFSMWGSFLGKMPTIYHPGRLQQKVLRDLHIFEGEWKPHHPLPDPTSK